MLDGVDGVLSFPPADAILSGVTGSNVIVELRYWHGPGLDDETRTRHMVVQALLDHLAESSLRLADPAIELLRRRATR